MELRINGDDDLLYLISDIHGDLKSFKELLKHIDFNIDRLIILGDVLDKGNKPMESLNLVRELMDKYSNQVILVKGNHELFASMYLDGKLSERTWLSTGYGGDETLASLKRMSIKEVEEFKQFIDNLPLYYEIDSPVFGDCIATHSGLYADYIVYNEDGSVNVVKSIEEGYRKDPFEYMCSGDIHRMPTNNLDRYMIVGHVPCVYLEGASYKILRRKGYMCIDSGADPGCKKLGGRLSMYCVDNDKEFYA